MEVDKGSNGANREEGESAYLPECTTTFGNTSVEDRFTGSFVEESTFQTSALIDIVQESVRARLR
jgi:hypothetical protein